MKYSLAKLLNRCYSATDKYYFFITSDGQTATNWLASMLNRHPKIACCHGYRYPQKFRNIADKDKEHAKIHAAKSISSERFWKMTPDQFLRDLGKNSGKPILGNIHGYTLQRLHQLLQEFPTQLNIVYTANMLRHPVTRISSTVHTWHHAKQNGEIPWMKDTLEQRGIPLLEEAGLLGKVDYASDQGSIFTCAMVQALDIAEGARLAEDLGIEQIKYEEITTLPESLKHLIQTITGAECKDAFIQQALKLDGVNMHHGKNRFDARARFNEWEPWEQKLFAYLVEGKGLGELYARLGYDMEFLTSESCRDKAEEATG